MKQPGPQSTGMGEDMEGVCSPPMGWIYTFGDRWGNDLSCIRFIPLIHNLLTWYIFHLGIKW